MNKKNIYIAGGVVLVGVIAYVIYSKNKKKKLALLKKEKEEQEAAEQLKSQIEAEEKAIEEAKDKAGNVGAIDISHKLDLPKAVKGQKGDERFSGKGLICVL